MSAGIPFKVYLLATSAEGKQEGFVLLWKHKGKLVKLEKPIPFDRLYEIPERIEGTLKRANIKWPVSK